MAGIQESLSSLLSIDGATGCCIVDYTSGMALGMEGGGVDLEMAAAGNSEVVKAKMETMRNLGISGSIEDILITLDDQFHVIRPLEQHEGLFMYLVLAKGKSNLALARRKVENIGSELAI